LLTYSFINVLRNINMHTTFAFEIYYQSYTKVSLIKISEYI